MLLKTYTRILTTDLASTVATLKALHGTEPHLSFDFTPWQLVAIGDVLVVGGNEETLIQLRGSLGPWIVEDINAVKSKLLAHGATIVRDVEEAPTGRMMYMRHADGLVVEYVQWLPELVENLVLKPLREGIPASQI